jgi:drug/metabolite transporter (DMT)-like permease
VPHGGIVSGRRLKSNRLELAPCLDHAASHEKRAAPNAAVTIPRLMSATAGTLTVGIACGAGAALSWAIGFVAARHGIGIGLSPADLAFHRYVWAGLLFLPMALRHRFADLGGIGWTRGAALTIFGGPVLAVISYAGFLLVPLGHGGLIQPSSAALFGLALSAIVLKEKLPPRRAIGALVIVLGLALIAFEALTTIGSHGLVGDLAFLTAGLFFAIFAMLLRLWKIDAPRAAIVISVVSLVDIPLHWICFGFERMIAAGFLENLLQALVQGIFAGPLAIFLFARSVVLLGAARAAVFPSLVPGFTLLIGFLVLGEVPSLVQIVGLAIVVFGFRLTQRG